jgi:regulatory protein
LVAAWLKVGQALSEEKIADLQTADARELAFQKAMRFLGYRARSVQEMRVHLQKHEIPEPVIDEVLKRLQETGLLNDQQFIQTWVENRNTFRPRSRRALALELRRKGLEDEVVQEALNESVDEDALALDAAQKYARKVQSLEWPDFRQKLGGFLGRRGFSYPVIAPVLRQIWDELHPGGSQFIMDDEETR